ncbi:hypothetical protein BURPS1710A_4197 [Burkholderia pseudomallei 1710a]|uniref:Uncharacterized protein n=1 Tax=Burkholderia pseudomallei 1710a TaxID=320371 RepID=A0A0E1W8N4_BURPE|nr:hypothetical protein BURPS1710A_4197 [Burkholderia pseudomallei 1710a]
MLNKLLECLIKDIQLLLWNKVTHSQPYFLIYMILNFLW